MVSRCPASELSHLVSVVRHDRRREISGTQDAGAYAFSGDPPLNRSSTVGIDIFSPTETRLMSALALFFNQTGSRNPKDAAVIDMARLHRNGVPGWPAGRYFRIQWAGLVYFIIANRYQASGHLVAAKITGVPLQPAPSAHKYLVARRQLVHSTCSRRMLLDCARGDEANVARRHSELQIIF